MTFFELAKERSSVRKFSDKQIEKEKLELVLKAGQLAPTANNCQPQRILVIENQNSIRKLRECTPAHFNAPTALLICYDSNVCCKNSYNNTDFGNADVNIVATHIMLQATEIGLGTTYVGYFNHEKFIKAFDIPNNIIPVVLIPIGYPADDVIVSANHNLRLSLDKTVFYNNFEKL